jgi:hypothetical protein
VGDDGQDYLGCCRLGMFELEADTAAGDESYFRGHYVECGEESEVM